MDGDNVTLLSWMMTSEQWGEWLIAKEQIKYALQKDEDKVVVVQQLKIAANGFVIY